MLLNDNYEVHIGLNKNVPFVSYDDDNEEGMTYHDVNIIEMSNPQYEDKCIVVEMNGKYADFYLDEDCFCQLTERGQEYSWEEFGVGRTPKCIKENDISYNVIKELIEY